MKASGLTVGGFYKHFRSKDELLADAIAWLRQLCLDAGADDVGFVERDRPGIADQGWRRLEGVKLAQCAF
jgi:AcrR family transcriptional regulator